MNLGRPLQRLNLSKIEVTIILAGIYIFFSLAANIASTKVTYFGKFVTDAGMIYYLTFTWRDLIHKQLGKKAALMTIYVAGFVNIIAALYYQLVVLLPAESGWALAGGQKAWELLFSLQIRIMIASVIAQVIAEVADTHTYQVWTEGIGKKLPQWTRVFVSNAISIPIDSILFPMIAFAGILGKEVILEIFLTNIILKAIVTLFSFWMIYLVPDKPIYTKDN